MKKLIPIVISSILLIIGIWFYLFSGLDQALLNLIILNVIIYFIRTILIRIINLSVRNRIIKLISTLILDILWISFLFGLLFYFSSTLAISIISFLIIAISLTFKDLISNVAAGIMILSSKIFEPGDLVKINNVEGIVEEITLNYTKIKEFDGVITYIPNSDIYNASVVKYTHRELKMRRDLFRMKKTEEDKSKIMKYAEKFKTIVEIEKKITIYVKTIEIIGTVDPNILDNKLNKVFDKYTPIFGLRPSYNVNHTNMDRCNISLRINSRNPNVVLEKTDIFMRDLLFELNSEEIFDGWDSYKATHGISEGG